MDAVVGGNLDDAPLCPTPYKQDEEVYKPEQVRVEGERPAADRRVRAASGGAAAACSCCRKRCQAHPALTLPAKDDAMQRRPAGGAAVLTIEQLPKNKPAVAQTQQPGGEVWDVPKRFKSGMINSWNKFCVSAGRAGGAGRERRLAPAWRRPRLHPAALRHASAG